MALALASGCHQQPATLATNNNTGHSCQVPKDNDMVWLDGGTFVMGSDDTYSEEGPKRRERVDGFWIDRFELTNAAFAKFIAATDYVTVAERTPNPSDATPIEMQQPGSAVFEKPSPDNPDWWRWKVGASWRHPEGLASTIIGKENEPVVHLAYEDAVAYAQWADKDLPTEAEWEFAARGGLDQARYAWGNDKQPKGQIMANHYQGVFPFQDDGSDGFVSRAPVGCFPANRFGLFDMTGNVWEWTKTAPLNARDTHVIKGGSYLCADNFCGRYRPAAKQMQEDAVSTNHIGVRFVRRNR